MYSTVTFFTFTWSSKTSKKEDGGESVSFAVGCGFFKLLNLTNNFRQTLRMDNKRVFLAHAKARHEAERRARQKQRTISTLKLEIIQLSHFHLHALKL